MTAFNKRFYKGADNYIAHGCDVTTVLDDDTVEPKTPVKFASAEKVTINLRAVRGPLPATVLPPDIFFDSLNPPDVKTFDRSDEGRCGVRYGDLPDTVPGITYQPRIKVYDLDNPDGLVVISYGEDAENDTWNLLCS